MSFIAGLRERWPEITDALYPDSRISILMLEADALVCVDDCHLLYNTMMVHMMAHMLTSESTSNGSNSGAVKQKKVGGVTTTYEVASANDKYFGSTKYGRMYISLCDNLEENNLPFFTTTNT